MSFKNWIIFKIIGYIKNIFKFKLEHVKMTTINKIPNALKCEKSPYLLQHAYNPVNWIPWF